MDKHFTLQTLLNSIVESHELLGWQIYQEKSGSTMFKIRFKNQVGDNTVDSHESVQEYSPRKFRKVSQKEQQRDVERAKKHRLRMSTKKPDRYTDPCNTSEKELPRSENPVQSPSHSNQMDSPESVLHELNVSTGNVSDIHVSSIPFCGDASDLVKSPFYYRDTHEADSVCASSLISEQTCVTEELVTPPSVQSSRAHVKLPDSASTLTPLTLQRFIRPNGCTREANGMHKRPCDVCLQDCTDSDENSDDEENSDSDYCNRQDYKYPSEID